MSGGVLLQARLMADLRDVPGCLSLRTVSPGARGSVRAHSQTLSPLMPLPVIERCESTGVSLVELARMAEEAVL